MAPSGRHIPALERQPQSRSDLLLRREVHAAPHGLLAVSRAPIAHYTHDHMTFDGFVFPARHIVYCHDQHGIADQSLALITLDLDDITVTGP